MSCSVPVYNYLIDKLEDEYDKRNRSRNDEIVTAISESLNKIKQYYASTGALIYSVATGKLLFYQFYIFITLLNLFSKLVLDPRLKLQYYKDNRWEESTIKDAKNQIEELWKSTYKVNSVVEDDSEKDDNNELFGHIFKKQRIEVDELSTYLEEKVVSSKTDILAWWKVHISIYYMLI